MSGGREPKKWPFEGQNLTLAEISGRVTAYSSTWIRHALVDGASCIADLHQRYAENLARERRTQITARRTHIVIGKGY